MLRQSKGPPPVQRDVFFVHGFEKRTARHHRLWQRREAARWSHVTGRVLHVGPMEAQEPGYARWTLTSDAGRIRFHLFDWSDLIAQRMATPWYAVVLGSLKRLGGAVRSGHFGKVRRRDAALWVLQMVGFGPIVASLALAIAAVLSGSVWVGGVAILAAFGTCASIAAGPRSPVRYVLDIAWGARRLALRDHAKLEARRAAFAARIAGAEGEVIVVGHSLGAAIALGVLPDKPSPDTTLLTVGQSIPLVALQDEALWAQEALRRVDCPWIDVSAGRDVLGFDGFDASQTGRAVCYGARFGRAFAPERLKALRWRGYGMHLLYFAAPQTAGLAWDWFGLLTDEARPAERMAGEPQKDGKGGRRWRF